MNMLTYSFLWIKQLDAADDNVSRSRRILSSMTRRMRANKFLLWGVIGLLVIIIVVIVWVMVRIRYDQHHLKLVAVAALFLPRYVMKSMTSSPFHTTRSLYCRMTESYIWAICYVNCYSWRNNSSGKERKGKESTYGSNEDNFSTHLFLQVLSFCTPYLKLLKGHPIFLYRFCVFDFYCVITVANQMSEPEKKESVSTSSFSTCSSQRAIEHYF